MFNRKVFFRARKEGIWEYGIYLDLFLSLTVDRSEWSFTRKSSFTLG